MPKKKETKKSNVKNTTSKKNQTTKKKEEIEEIEVKSKKGKAILWLVLIVGVIVAIMLSPLFTIKTIEVNNNEKVSSEEIIKLSEIKINDNMFWKTSSMIKKNVKANPYIDKVFVTRVLPDKLIIKVIERNEDYLLIESNSNYYINNQGFVLATGDATQGTVSIYGISEHSILPGDRVSEYNLKKLNIVNQIMNNCEDHYIDAEENVALSEIISSIDITMIDDITVYLKSEEKNIHIGDDSNLNGKFTYIPKILEATKGTAGDIYVNMNLSEKSPYFSPKRDANNKEENQVNE